METSRKVNFDNTATAFSYKSTADLRRANFIFSLVNHPWMSGLATGLVRLALNLGLPVEEIIRRTAFNHFCGGISIRDSEKVIANLAAYKVSTILDYSVEGEKSEAGFDATMEETLQTIALAKTSKHIPFAVFKVTGLASVELLEKIQSAASLTELENAAWERVQSRVNSICSAGAAAGIPVLIDAEETWIQEPIDKLAYDMMQRFNKDRAIVYNTYQMYCTRSLSNLKSAFHDAAMHQYYLGAKLVRGAYMEKERERAADMGYDSPIHPSKEATDTAYNQALNFCLDNKQRIYLMSGSHNDYSNYYLVDLMGLHGLAANDPRVWFAQLYGMSDNISFNLAGAGYNVAKYLPYGPVRSVMPYLFRRAQENTSVAGQSSRELRLIREELRRRRNPATSNA